MILSGLLLSSVMMAGLLPAEMTPVHSDGPKLPPVLFVQMSGSAGSQVIFHEGAGARRFPAPVTVGLRPGYCYRLELTNFPDHPGVALFPSIEVRGTIIVPPGVNPAKYPALVRLSRVDIDHILSGAFLTKVVYLENPETAVTVTSASDEAVELELPPVRDLLEEARLRGRPVLVFRVGQRDVSPEELQHETVPGTILYPGETALAPPSAPPCLPAICFSMVDPRLGPKPPLGECLRDGGDGGTPIGLGHDGRLYGLDPADTAAVYTDNLGTRRVTVSNPVCLFAPRFAVLRAEIAAAGTVATLNPAKLETLSGRSQLREALASQVQRRPVPPELVQSRLSATESRTTQGLIEAERFLGMVEVRGKIGQVEVVGVCVSQREAPARPLLLCKWADKRAVQLGETVTFYLKYSNQGGQPIRDVVVSDSLTGRLEYVTGTAQADREAVFTIQSNEAGSVILRWQIGGTLPPGQSGLLKFEARVR